MPLVPSSWWQHSPTRSSPKELKVWSKQSCWAPSSCKSWNKPPFNFKRAPCSVYVTRAAQRGVGGVKVACYQVGKSCPHSFDRFIVYRDVRFWGGYEKTSSSWRSSKTNINKEYKVRIESWMKVAEEAKCEAKYGGRGKNRKRRRKKNVCDWATTIEWGGGGTGETRHIYINWNLMRKKQCVTSYVDMSRWKIDWGTDTATNGWWFTMDGFGNE